MLISNNGSVRPKKSRWWWWSSSSSSSSGWWFGTWLLFSISYMGCHPSHWRHHIFQEDGETIITFQWFTADPLTPSVALRRVDEITESLIYALSNCTVLFNLPPGVAWVDDGQWWTRATVKACDMAKAGNKWYFYGSWSINGLTYWLRTGELGYYRPVSLDQYILCIRLNTVHTVGQSGLATNSPSKKNIHCRR